MQPSKKQRPSYHQTPAIKHHKKTRAIRKPHREAAEPLVMFIAMVVAFLLGATAHDQIQVPFEWFIIAASSVTILLLIAILVITREER